MIKTEDLIDVLYKDMIDSFHQKNSFNVISIDSVKEYAKIPNKFDASFLYEIITKIKVNRVISSKQLTLLHNTLIKYSGLLVELGVDAKQFDEWSRNFSNSINTYESKNIKREVRYLDDDVLFFRFLHVYEIVTEIKKLNEFYKTCTYNKKNNGIAVRVDEKNINKVMQLISKYNFSFDSEVENFFLTHLDSKFKIEIKENSENNFNLIVSDSILIKNWLEQNFLMSE